MMGKACTLLLRYLLLSGSAAILITGLSKSIQRRIHAKGIIPDQYRYGDLYNTSYLNAFKEVDFKANAELLQDDRPNIRFKNVDLYTIGDSFTPMDTSFYAGDKNYHIWLGVNQQSVTLDPAKHSILIIEIIERTIQERLREDFQELYIDKGFAFAEKPDRRVSKDALRSSFATISFGDQINERLEYMLFNFDPILAVKELKSKIMMVYFGRTHSGAMISNDEKYLFYEIEADRLSRLSSFYPLAQIDIDLVVTNINHLRSHYLKMGFAEVYFCLIPNKTTVCSPCKSHYNHQISRVENHPELKAPMLSVSDSIANHPDWYHKGDGHWNVQGKRFWLRTVNKLVEKWSEKKTI